MYVSSGSLDDVLKWFHNSHFRYLLLFAAGAPKSATFLGSLFDEKETIDLVSSEDIAVFLFCANATLALRLEAQEGHPVYIPGERLAEPAAVRPYRWNTTQTEAVPVTEIWDAEIRKQVVASSITFTHQLARFYDISLTELPALVLLNKWTPDPIVVPTRDVADVKAVLDFLREIRQIKLPWIELPKTQKSDVRRRLREAKLHLERSEHRLDLAISSWRKRLVARQVDEELLKLALTKDNADEVWVVCGSKGPDAMPDLLRPNYALFQSVVGEEEFREACRVVRNKADLYRSHIRTVEDLEKRVGYYERLARDADERLRDIPLVEAKIIELCGKYERKFHLKHAVTQVATVVKSIIGVTKGAKDIADAKAHILKLLGD